MSNIFFLVFSEFILFWTLVDHYSFGQVLLWYWAPSFLALGLLTLFGRTLLMRAQLGMSQGLGTARASLHPMAVLLGLLFLLLPFLITRILGLGLILPGLRHLIIWKFRDFMVLKVRETFQNPNASGFRFYSRGFGFEADTEAEVRVGQDHDLRDVSPKGIAASEAIIDVTATSRSIEEKSDKGST